MARCFKTKRFKDDDGFTVGHGDTISFSYGLPPVGVRAKVKWNGHAYICLTPGHNPEWCYLKDLKHISNFYKRNIPEKEYNKRWEG